MRNLKVRKGNNDFHLPFFLLCGQIDLNHEDLSTPFNILKIRNFFSYTKLSFSLNHCFCC